MHCASLPLDFLHERTWKVVIIVYCILTVFNSESNGLFSAVKCHHPTDVRQGIGTVDRYRKDKQSRMFPPPPIMSFISMMSNIFLEHVIISSWPANTTTSSRPILNISTRFITTRFITTRKLSEQKSLYIKFDSAGTCARNGL